MSALLGRMPERSIAELGIYPAVDPLASTSRILGPAIDGEEHYAVARQVQRILSQPFFVAEAFTGTPGKYVKLEDTVKSFKRIVDGEFDDLPEQAFYMKGGNDEVIEAAEKIKAQG